jgi:hypothetical protein
MSKSTFEPIPASDDKSYESDESDESFGWYDAVKHDKEGYFCLVNIERKSVKPGE